MFLFDRLLYAIQLLVDRLLKSRSILQSAMSSLGQQQQQAGSSSKGSDDDLVEAVMQKDQHIVALHREVEVYRSEIER
jgi:hypothetical protein